MISSLWPPVIRGGAEKYAAELADRLRQRSHEVEAVTFGIDGPDVAGTVRAWPYRVEDYAGQGLPRRLIFHGLDVYRPATSRAIRDAIQRFSPDVVHSHFVTGLSSAALSEPGRNRIPHVHSLHGYWLLCQRTSLCRRDGTNCDVRCAGCRAVSSVRNAVIGAIHPTSSSRCRSSSLICMPTSTGSKVGYGSFITRSKRRLVSRGSRGVRSRLVTSGA